MLNAFFNRFQIKGVSKVYISKVINLNNSNDKSQTLILSWKCCFVLFFFLLSSLVWLKSVCRKLNRTDKRWWDKQLNPLIMSSGKSNNRLARNSNNNSKVAITEDYRLSWKGQAWDIIRDNPESLPTGSNIYLNSEMEPNSSFFTRARIASA